MRSETALLIVAIYLRGDQLDPTDVTRSLGIVPTESQKKGDKLISSTGKKASRRTGIWCVKAQSTSLTLSDHVAELMNLFGQNKRDLKLLKNVEDAYFDVFLATDQGGDSANSTTLSLQSSEVDFISSLGLSIQITTSTGPD
jgi:hypothetical protein